MLLVRRSGIVEDNAVEMFRHYVLFFLDVKFQVLLGKIIMWQDSHSLSTPSILLTNLWFMRLQEVFLTLRARSCPNLCPLIHSPRRPLTLRRGRIPIRQSFVPPTLAAYCVALSSAWRCRQGFSFSYLSGTSRERIKEFMY